MWFSRIRCHFCGSKQPHSKSVTEFQCSECEAVNYLDGRGNILDTPASVAAPSTNAHATSIPSFSRPLPEASKHQQTATFCRTCAQNQHLFNETLANYLPDESHPQYHEFAKAIPAYKVQLEKRYPLVCKKCAPQAQSTINRADSYGMKQNARKLITATRARGGMPAMRTRDDWGKKSMRLSLNLVGLALYLGLFAQVAYHISAIVTLAFPPTLPAEDDSEPSFSGCVAQSLDLRLSSACRLHFDVFCDQLFPSLIPRTLMLAVCCLWYNPGIKAWFHHTQRMEAVKGQTNYFFMQLVILAIRLGFWNMMSNRNIMKLVDTQLLMAVHFFTAFFAVLAQLVANRGIQPVRWTLKGKIMPKPSEVDVLSASAGPSPEHYTPKASGADPFRYLRNPNSGPFDINSLAPKPPKQPSFSQNTYLTQQPSPEDSDSDEDEDAMETDHRPVMRSSQSSSRASLQPRHNTGLGFGTMTDEVFRMQTDLRQKQEQYRVEQEQKPRYQPPDRQRSPFYGKIPPAPMSMERRLRNPVFTPLQPERVPLSQQKNFMDQMRAGVKPVQFPEKGTNFELKPSEWVLPGDVKETGLEDRFLNTFNLTEPTPPGPSSKRGFLGLF